MTKAIDYTFLSHLLMGLEAHLVLDIVVPEIVKKDPSIPLFTIHDCIATTIGNEKVVAKIMRETIVEFIGI